MTTRALRLLPLALACLLAPSIAAAQGKPPAPAAPAAPTAQDTAEAKRHYDVAEKLYAQDQYEPALSEYLTSYKLDPRKRSPLRNAADCQRKLNRFADAYESYARLVDEHGDKLKPAEKKGVVQEMNELAQLTGSIEVASSEPGAEVTIDGAAIGVTPLPRPKRVSIAKHKVRVSKAGFDPFEAEVEVASLSAIKLRADLAPERSTGRLSVREQGGKPVHVLVDDKDMGPAPWEGELTPGEHTLELKGDKLAVEKRTLTIPKKERVELVLAAESIVGHLRVTASPAAAQISVDGKPVGNGAWEADVDPGVHQIEVALGEAKAQREITLKRGESMAQEIPLVVAPPVEAPSFRGVYGGFTVGYAYWATAPQFDPKGTSGVTVAHDIPVVVPLTVRVGYAFDFWAIELVGTATFERAVDEVTLPASLHGSIYENDMYGAGGFFGIGARLSTKTDPARFTGGVAPGVAVHSIRFSDNYDYMCNMTGTMSCPPPMTSSFKPWTTWVAPGFHADLALTLGSTPGRKFVLALEAWVELPQTVTVGPDTTAPFAGTVFPEPNRSYLLAKSPEVFVGPSLGVQWGH